MRKTEERYILINPNNHPIAIDYSQIHSSPKYYYQVLSVFQAKFFETLEQAKEIQKKFKKDNLVVKMVRVEVFDET